MRVMARGREEEGAALIIALCVVVIMVIIGGTVMTMSFNNLKTVGIDQRTTMAQNFAEAGVDDAISVTVANYANVYATGYPTMATPFFDGPNNGEQNLTDKGGNVLGTYQVWTQSDPDRPGNVLITSIGKDLQPNSPSRTVRMSVKYTPDIFAYVLLSGNQTSPVTQTYTAQGSSYSEHDDGWHEGDSMSTANIALTGNVGANGSMVITSSRSGEHWGEHEEEDDHDDHDDHDDDEDHDHDHNYYESPGTVSFLSRDGYVDSASYTNYFTGPLPLGNQPVLGSYVNFPNATLNGPTPDGTSVPDVKTLNLPDSGTTYTGGWTRVIGSKIWRISSSNFQDAYGMFSAVKISTAAAGYTVEIYGNCGSSAITSTIWLEGAGGTEGNVGASSNIDNLNLVGPGIRLYPANGIAILADRGAVSITNEAFVGKMGAGALIYQSGVNGATSFSVTGNLVMYGSVVVNGPTSLTAEGNGIRRHDHEREDEHDEGHTSGHCSGDYSHDHEYDDWHEEHHHRTYVTNIQIDYDGAFLDNSHNWKPLAFWQWTGSGDVQAVKENFDVS